MPITVCPPVDKLLAGLSGAATNAAASELEQHVESCSTCQDRIKRLATGAVSWDYALRYVADVPEQTVDTDLELVVNKILTPIPPPDRFRPGQMIDDYRLEEQLGEGGMGTVWRARHSRLDMSVALKVISRKLTGDPGAEERFAREMKAVGRLDHPNIVRATDAGEAEGRPYLVMEYLDGRDLSKHVRANGAIALPLAFQVIRDAALGLQHAHEAGLIHRDVKPSNLFLTNDGIIKLLDLGLARFAETDVPIQATISEAESTHDASLTGACHALGTRDYMAPEQSRSPHNVDARADVYGLGATLLYLITGAHPQPGAESDAVARGVPPTLLKRLLAPEPADRFATAADVAKALQDISTAQNAPSDGRRIQKWRLSLGIALAIVVGLLFTFLRPGTWTVASDNENHGGGVSQGPPAGRLPMSPTEAKALQEEWAKHLNRLVAEPAPQGLTMMLIPPGSFGMSIECRVEISRPFEIAEREVTVRQFQQFVNATGYRTDSEKSGLGGWCFDRTNYHNMQQRDPKFVWRTPGYSQVTENHPVTQVSWHDAVAYCTWLSTIDNRIYRLPTEAEWRWACRSGSSSDFAFGDDKNKLPEHGWFVMNALEQPQPVGQLKPNAWGLLDMHGNVSEWCQDWFAPLPTSPRLDYRGPDQGDRKVIAGGSHSDVRPDCHYRQGTGHRASISFLGFRVVRDVN